MGKDAEPDRGQDDAGLQQRPRLAAQRLQLLGFPEGHDALRRDEVRLLEQAGPEAVGVARQEHEGHPGRAEAPAGAEELQGTVSTVHMCFSTGFQALF